MTFTLPLLPHSDHVRVVLVGDIVGKPGMRIACAAIAGMRKHLGADCVIANAENAADGSGLTLREYKRLCQAGVDAITLGDHIYRKKEIIPTLVKEDNIVKAANFPDAAPGKTWCQIMTSKGIPVAVISLMGRVFMRPVDCPWTAADKVLQQIPAEIKLRIVDFHGEATSDKQIMGRYLDGRVTAVLGTHTHVPTADEQIFAGGTAFQCDVGMTGPHHSILGRDIERVLQTTVTFQPTSFLVATEDIKLNATWVDADPNTGKAIAIGRLCIPESVVKQWNAPTPPQIPLM